MTDYELSDYEIVQRLIQAAAQAGVHGSGYVVSLAGPAFHDSMRYWEGVLKARLDGVKPPVKEGDKLRPKTPRITPAYAGPDTTWPSSREIVGELTVKEIKYVDRRWFIDFRERTEATCYDMDDGDRVQRQAGRCRFHFDDFEPVPVEEKSAP